MVNAGIPRRWRDWVPLVICGEDIIWVVGWRIADPVKVTARTRQILCLEFELSP
jgi:tRNA(Ile)-lysidine synthase